MEARKAVELGYMGKEPGCNVVEPGNSLSVQGAAGPDRSSTGVQEVKEADIEALGPDCSLMGERMLLEH
jgi:hypothetical protein